MAITIEDVEHIAKLANLSFSQEEKEKFTRQLAEIIAYVEKLNELDTTNVPPTYHVLELSNVYRGDVEGECLSPEEATANAPKKMDNFFSVPKVISQDKNG
jgi:aspartyl-tRNA(Asn)/glutamyl-tRNA(Gln) amidotransferase subunit C